MSTIINTPGNNDSGNSAAIWVIGLIVIVLIGLFAFFIWPNFSNNSQTTVVMPAADNSNSGTVPSSVVNNTTINASSTTNNSTTTKP